ncbi:MAG TPA: PKD domain-containing protein [Candidatus Binatia bacterium]
MKATRTLVAMFLLLSGCGSCQRSAEAPGESAGAPTAAVPLQARDKIQVAPLPPAAGDRPGAASKRQVEGNVVPTPIEPPLGEGAAEGSAAEPEESDGDCIVVADADPDYGPPPLAVTFSAEAECNAGQPTYKWNFGDGSPPNSETNPTHTYAKAGDYTASVAITGPGGATASDEVDITVEEGEGEPQE